MNILTAESLALSFGVTDIFEGISVTVKEQSHIGLVGSNGAGKTSLLKMICGQLEPSKGSVHITKGMKVSYLSQLSDYTSEKTVWQDVMTVFEDIFRLEEDLRDIEEAMGHAEADDFEALSHRYDETLKSFEDAGGYRAERSARSVLAGLNIPQDMHDRPVSTLSGGQRARVALAAALLCSPDLLLLDEPTNHLDLDAIGFLENYLSQFSGAFILVSHDRYFLDKVCKDIWEMSMGSLTTYTGNFTTYLEKREAIYEQKLKEYKQNLAYIKREEAIIRKYRSWATEKKLKMAKSREKRLAKVERVDKPITENTIAFRFSTKAETGMDVLRCEDLAMSYGTKEVFKDIDLHIRAGEKIALLGPNGIGKTTLLKIISKSMKPTAGAYLHGTGVVCGYYDQHQQNLSESKTAIDEIWDAFPSLDHQQVRDTLALFLFRGDDIEKPISALSGGERGRLSLLKLMLSNANFLLLDEPTNHLDMDSRQVLEEALIDFPGTVLFVSHDRYFINRVANRILTMEQQSMESYEGNWNDYLYHLSLQRKAEEDSNKESKTQRAKRFQEEREKTRQLQQLRACVEELEAEIEAIEENITHIEAKLSTPDALNPDELSKLSQEHQAQEAALEECMLKWEDASAKLSL